MDSTHIRIILYFFLVSQLGLLLPQVSGSSDANIKYVSALLNASFREFDQLKQIPVWNHITGDGKFAAGAANRAAKGYLYYIPNNDWCTPISAKVPEVLKPWIALIERGNCEFRMKILNAKALNASAVVIFDNVSSGLDDVSIKSYGVGDIVAVSISKDFGQRLGSKVENTRLHLKIDVGDVHYHRKREWQVGGKTSVLFVLVSFILLMCISLAWLVFYYVQRFRYFYARDKKEKQLMNAAKKAISKLKTRTCDGPEVKEEQEETCAVCLEGYKNGETLRVLSCRHEFHKICVDPWLLEHRTCPICKTNILKALGLAVSGVGSGDIDLETVVPEPSQVAYASEELEPQADTSSRVQADSKASSCAGDEEQCSFSRSITVNSSGSTSMDDDESSINSTSVLVAQGYA